MLFKQFLFVFIFGCAGSSLLRRVSSRCRGWGLLSVAVWGLLSVVVSLAVEPGLQGAQTHQLWCTGLAAQHVGPSQTRDRACVSCIGRLILQHWASREAPNVPLECYSYGRKKTLITGRRELFCLWDAVRQMHSGTNTCLLSVLPPRQVQRSSTE